RAGGRGGVAALRRPDRRAGAHRAGTAGFPWPGIQVGRARVPDDERGESGPACLRGARSGGSRTPRRAASQLRLRRAHLPWLSARAARGAGGAARGAGALASRRARRRAYRVYRLHGDPRDAGISRARAPLSAETDHLPARLWWLLAALTLAWGFNWTAMKLALAEVPPWIFRSLCLGLGSAVLFLVLRLGGQPIPLPRGQWLRIAM